MLQAEKEEEWRGKGRGGGKNIEKLRRQLAELEAQLVLASPHLLFQVRIRDLKFYFDSQLIFSIYGNFVF